MEGADTEKTAQPAQPTRARVGIDLRLLAILLVIATGLRAWVVARTEVPARDSIGYIRYAWRLQDEPWSKVMRDSERHPGYPLAIYFISLPVRHIVAGPDALAMQLSAQAASSVAGVLLVIPMYFLGRVLFGRVVGFWSALLFQCLPESGLVLSDGLSEGVFLLFAATALLMAVHALQGSSPWRFALCGLFGGLAFLTRPEGGLIIAVTGLVLLGSQAVRAWRRPWSRLALCGVCLALVALTIAAPFWLTIRRLSTQPTTGRVINNALLEKQIDPFEPRNVRNANGRPLFAATMGLWWDGHEGERTKRFWWGMQAVAQETIKGFHFVTWLPALLGLWWFRDRFHTLPGAWVLFLLSALIALALWRVAVVLGYTSDRHTLLIVLCGTFWGVAGIQRIGEYLATLCRRQSAQSFFRHAPLLGRSRQLTSDNHFWSVALFFVLIASGLPKTLAPLHADRAGHRTAGLWLAEHAGPSDLVEDPFCWAHFYAGKVFLEGLTLPPSTMRYVVLEKSKNPHSRLTSIPELRKLVEQQGTLVYHCPLKRPKTREEIEVFAVPLAGGGR